MNKDVDNQIEQFNKEYKRISVDCSNLKKRIADLMETARKISEDAEKLKKAGFRILNVYEDNQILPDEVEETIDFNLDNLDRISKYLCSDLDDAYCDCDCID